MPSTPLIRITLPPLVPHLMTTELAHRLETLDRLETAVEQDDVVTALVLLAGGYPDLGPPPPDPDPQLGQEALAHHAAVRLRQILGSPDAMVARVVQRGHPAMMALFMPHGLAADAFLQVANAERLAQLQGLGWVLRPETLGFRLVEAAYALDVDLARLWLQQGARPDAMTDHGHNVALHQAATWLLDRHEPEPVMRMIDLLLEHGGSLEQRDGEGQTVLLAALSSIGRSWSDEDRTPADRCQMQVIQGLLARGANPAAVGPRGSALRLAIGVTTETARLAWEMGVIQALHDGGGSLVEPVPIEPNPAVPERRTESPANALLVAVLHGHRELVRLCLDLGEDVNRPAPEGWWVVGERPVPLQVAALHGDVVLLDLMIAAGADVMAALDPVFWELGGDPMHPEAASPERWRHLRVARAHLERRVLLDGLAADEAIRQAQDGGRHGQSPGGENPGHGVDDPRPAHPGPRSRGRL